MTTPLLDMDRASAPAVLLLDVGQGDASIILLPGAPRRAIIVDCNDARVVHQHLLDYQVQQVTAVVFSHLDLDHIRGGLALVQTWRAQIEQVYVDSDGRTLSDAEENQSATELLDVLLGLRGRGDTPGPTLLKPQRGTVLASGAGWRVRLLAPDHAHGLAEVRGARPRTSNEHSAVVRVEVDVPGGQRAVVIGGDAPLRVWSEMATAERRADVFRIPHHGGALNDGGIPEGWNIERLYDDVGASDVVISVGTMNRHGHPSPEWRRPLISRAGCHVRCTQVTPACHPAAPDGEESHRRRETALTNRSHSEPAWRHFTRTHAAVTRDANFREVPCAGTVSVGFGSGGDLHVRPLAADHQRPIDLWDTPWCRPRPPALAPDPADTDPLASILGA